MSFNSILGVLFAAGVFLGCWALPTRFRNPFLLLSSFAFYAYGDPLYLLLLLLVIAVGYIGGRMIDRGDRSKLTLTACVILLLALLGVFKYFNFFMQSFAALLQGFGLHTDTITLQVLLPIGISFYIFQTIGYLVDVYRRQVRAETSVVNFSLFVSFFPQLVAGPIERSTNLLRQVRAHRAAPALADVTYGMFLILQGYAKKIVIADRLGPYVDLIFQQQTLSAPLIFVGLLFFALQIYGDFSGYTDIARGYARLLGFRLILNFDRPYFATSPSNFWRRWHISLSSWFTEYVYITLGGNRSAARARRWANVVATMGLSGLWHGASANFILWGVFHGLLIVGQRGLQAISGLQGLNDRFRTLPSRVLTFLLVLYGWLLFRITDFDRLIAYHADMTVFTAGWFEASLVLSQGFLFLVAAIIIDVAEKHWLRVKDSVIRSNRGLSVYLAGLFLFIVFCAAEASGSFIYFRF